MMHSKDSFEKTVRRISSFFHLFLLLCYSFHFALTVVGCFVVFLFRLVKIVLILNVSNVSYLFKSCKFISLKNVFSIHFFRFELVKLSDKHIFSFAESQIRLTITSDFILFIYNFASVFPTPTCLRPCCNQVGCQE